MGKLGASHCKHWGRCCIVVSKCMNRYFAVVSGVTQAVMYRMGVHVAQGEVVDFGVVWPNWPSGFRPNV